MGLMEKIIVIQELNVFNCFVKMVGHNLLEEL